MQHVDEQGRLTGQTVFQQAIPADLIQDGRGSWIDDCSAAELFRRLSSGLGEGHPGKDGAAESVEQLCCRGYSSEA